jgi:cytoskeletal protein CcmA (bactofilin family)
MFGGSKSGNLPDSDRLANMDGLTGLERAKLERSLRPVEPQPPPAPVVVPSKPMAAVLVPQPELTAQPVPAPESAAHLYAGPGVKLKGEIVGCDTLRIEGIVDGNATARQLILCPGGSFLGTAEIEEAEIEGNFDGTLNVRSRLVLRANGRVAGTLSYGEIEIERGGEIAGQITPQGKQIAAMPRSETAFVSVSNERRALSAVPKLSPQSVVHTLHPAAPRAETAAAVVPAAPVAAPTPAKPNPPTRLEQTAAARLLPAVEPPAKARKVGFFGRR